MIARIRRWFDRRKNIRCTITSYQWALMQGNMDYRERRYYQINRGRG